MRRSLATVAAVAALCGLIPPDARAGLTPSYGAFGPLAEATFGGSGIPNDAVASRVILDGGATITLGLTATPRYSSPAVANNDAGTFFAQPGLSTGGPTTGAAWNFNYFIKLTGVGVLNPYLFRLDTFLDAQQDTFQSTSFYATSLSPVQDSQNLAFAAFNGGTFDPFAEGTYGFRLTALRNTGTLFAPRYTQVGDSVSILVNVGPTEAVNAIPEPSTFLGGLLAVGLLLGGASRRLRRRPA